MNNGNGAMTRKALMGGAIGNFVEWYDWGLYGMFATTIAAQFFPNQDPIAALLSTFAVYAISYFVRPLGGILFGHLADRHGRRTALLLAIMLMSAGTFAMGLLPTYAQIGIAAPVLLLVCRIVQGFSAGGEGTNSGAFVVEHAPRGRRGLYASITPAMGSFAPLIGLFVGLAVTTTTTPQQLGSWGWRLPFLAAAPLALLGLYLRLRLEESPVFVAIRAEQNVASAPVIQALRVAKKRMLVLVVFAMVYAVTFGVLATFLLSYLNVTLKFSKTDSLIEQVVYFLAALTGCVLAGYLIDRVGLQRVAVASALGLAVSLVPVFMLLQHSTLLRVCLIVTVPALFYGGISATTYLAAVELFPARIRASASGLAYQVSFAVFGGTTPYVATFLVGQGLSIGPAYYAVTLAVVLALVAALGLGKQVSDRGLEMAALPDESSEQANV